MNDGFDRPKLSFGDLSEIADDLYEMDKTVWDILRPWLMPKGISGETAVSGPRPPRLTAKFYLVLRNYSMEAFLSEANRYPRYPPNPNFSTWLLNLARRVEDHAIDVVRDIELSDPNKDFGYHLVAEKEMRKAIQSRLQQEMEEHYQLKSPASSPLLPPDVQRQLEAPPSEELTSPRASSTETTAVRRAFIEPLLEAKGWSVLDWANEARVAHATAMDFLQGKTWPYRSTRLKLAGALGVSVDKLPR